MNVNCFNLREVLIKINLHDFILLQAAAVSNCLVSSAERNFFSILVHCFVGKKVYLYIKNKKKQKQNAPNMEDFMNSKKLLFREGLY